MTALEQVELFRTLKAAHPKWTQRFTSGYVAGAAAAHDSGKLPPLSATDDYCRGLMLGFAIHSGSDVEFEKWFGGLA